MTKKARPILVFSVEFRLNSVFNLARPFSSDKFDIDNCIWLIILGLCFYLSIYQFSTYYFFAAFVFYWLYFNFIVLNAIFWKYPRQLLTPLKESQILLNSTFICQFLSDDKIWKFRNIAPPLWFLFVPLFLLFLIKIRFPKGVSITEKFIMIC